MPELPEVETIVRQMQKQVSGKRISYVEVKVRKLVHGKIPLVSIKKVWRRAKAIIMELGDGRFVVIRLGMTGHFHYYKSGVTLPGEDKYIVVKFIFSDGSLLTFNDIRKFGSVRVLSLKELDILLAKMGPEPLSKEFTLAVFQNLLLEKQNANMKVTLLDQHFIAGIGNIYAQEMLYRAGIDPRRKILTLSDAEIRKLYLAMRGILKLAIEHHGTTVQDYVHIEGSGGFQRYLQVYEREKCPQGHLLKKIYLGARGTYWCQKCQK